MAVEKDQPAWLPEPPPPRPARREAAIEAALRKFDGTDEVSAATRERRPPSWAAGHRPQLGLAIASTLIVVIGIPAALIGIRNQVPAPERAAPPPVVRNTQPQASVPPAQPAPAPSPQVAEVAPSAPAPASPPKVEATKSAGNARAAGDQVAPEVAPSPMIAAAPPAAPAPPPPPPPPPAPAQMADRAAREATGDIVVTGTRIQGNMDNRADGLAVAKSSKPDAQAQAYEAFLSRLQAAVRSNDRRAITRLIGYPLCVNAAGGARIYRDRRSVERDFDAIFTARVRQAILGQRPERLFVRDQGAMIGSGQVWFDQTCGNTACSPPGPVRIKAVNP